MMDTRTYFWLYRGIFGVRLCGFGWFMWNYKTVPLADNGYAKRSGALIIFPSWKFTFLSPWSS